MRRLTIVIIVAALLAACGPPTTPALPPQSFPTATLQPIDTPNLQPAEPGGQVIQPTATATPEGPPTATSPPTQEATAVPPTNTPEPPPPTEGPTATPQPTNTPLPPSVYTVLLNEGDLSTMAGLVERAGLAESLSSPGGFTVFAPTNAAFDALEQGFIDGLLSDPQALQNVIYFHVVPRRVTADDLAVAEASFPTLLGVDLVIAEQLGQGVSLLRSNTSGENGIVHVVDGVLFPPE